MFNVRHQTMRRYTNTADKKLNIYSRVFRFAFVMILGDRNNICLNIYHLFSEKFQCYYLSIDWICCGVSYILLYKNWKYCSQTVFDTCYHHLYQREVLWLNLSKHGNHFSNSRDNLQLFLADQKQYIFNPNVFIVNIRE